MNVSLTKELENFVSELVASGTYFSASEVVRDALRLLKEQEALKKMRVEELRAEILRGYEQSQNGESKPLDIETIQAAGEKVLAEKERKIMARILFTPLASEDLRDIWIYLTEKAGSETANKFLSEVKKKCESVAAFPEMGRVRHEYLINLRSFSFSNYIIFYLPLEDGVEILRIVHGSRDIPQVFDEMIPLEP